MISRGWSYFLLGLLISSFLGGAIRVYFSPQRLRAWVEAIEAEKQPKFKLEFENAKLTFAHGWVPGLAVEFENLQVKARDICLTGTEIHIDSLNVPIQMSGLFSRSVKLGIINAENMVIRSQEPKCDSQLSIPEVVDGSGEAENDLAEFEKFIQTRWRQEIKNTLVLMDGLQIQKLSMYTQNSKSPIFLMHAFEARIAAEDFRAILDFSIQPGVLLVGHEQAGKLKSHIELTPSSFQFNGRGNLKEGQLESQLNWNINDGYWQGHLEMRDLPSANLISILDLWGLAKLPGLNLRNEWFRCQLKAEGNLLSWQSTPVRYEGCNFYGDLGEIHILPGESFFLKGELFPISADFRNVKMDPILAHFGGLRQFVSVEGVTTGQLNINESGSLDYSGLWRNLKVSLPHTKYFDSNSLNISQMKLDWSYNNEISDLSISELTSDGEDLVMTFNFRESLAEQSRLIRWNIDFETWPKSFSQLTKSIKAKSFFSKGHLQIRNEENEFETVVKFKDLEFEKMRSQDVSFNIRLAQNKGSFFMLSKKIDFDKDTPFKLFPKFISKMEKHEFKPDKLELIGEFEMDGRWVLNPVTFETPGEEISASFVGKGFKFSVDQGVFQVLKGKEVIEKQKVYGTLREPRFESN